MFSGISNILSYHSIMDAHTASPFLSSEQQALLHTCYNHKHASKLSGLYPLILSDNQELAEKVVECNTQTYTGGFSYTCKQWQVCPRCARRKARELLKKKIRPLLARATPDQHFYFVTLGCKTHRSLNTPTHVAQRDWAAQYAFLKSMKFKGFLAVEELKTTDLFAGRVYPHIHAIAVGGPGGLQLPDSDTLNVDVRPLLTPADVESALHYQVKALNYRADMASYGGPEANDNLVETYSSFQRFFPKGKRRVKTGGVLFQRKRRVCPALSELLPARCAAPAEEPEPRVEPQRKEAAAPWWAPAYNLLQHVIPDFPSKYYRLDSILNIGYT